MKKITLMLIAAMSLLPFLSAARGKGEKSIGIVAHRGFWNCEEAGYARNSIAALRCAQEAGFWGSEFDVNMTADSVLIVHHDSDVEGKKIEKHPYAEFKDFRIANGEVIPTVDAYLEQGKKYPETMLVYEIKPHSSDLVEDIVVDLSIAKLQEHGLLDPQRVMFISFSLRMCERLAGKLPGFTVQFLGSSMNPAELAERGISGVDYNHEVYNINKRWYRMARKHDMSVNAWTVDNEKDMKRMFRMRVDQLTTDKPLTARSVLEKMKIKEAK